jgi:hypothetical protein
MKLSEHQAEFIMDVSRLIRYAYQNEFRLSGSHLWRSPEEQKRLISIGASKTMKSRHLNRLAIDFVIRRNVGNDPGSDVPVWKIITSWEQAILLGEFWEDMDRKNVWGGFWQSFRDAPHFERRQIERKIRIKS